MPATPFAGHSQYSVSKAIYDHPELVAPADRLYAADGADADTLPDTYANKSSSYANQPGNAARRAGYPQSY